MNPKRFRIVLAVVALSALAAATAARAQDAAAAPAEVRPDSAAAPAAAAPVTIVRAPRASWLSDRLPLGVGDLVTVVVSEQTNATEHVSHVATGNRSSQADLNASISSSDARIGPQKSFGTGINSGSRDVGDAGRQAGFTAVITVRVTELSPGGLAKIAGTKQVSIDGRTQDVTLTGTIRTADVDARNQVQSSRIADAVITYKGKKIAPRAGFLGALLGKLWP